MHNSAAGTNPRKGPWYTKGHKDNNHQREKEYYVQVQGEHGCAISGLWITLLTLDTFGSFEFSCCGSKIFCPNGNWIQMKLNVSRVIQSYLQITYEVVFINHTNSKQQMIDLIPSMEKQKRKDSLEEKERLALLTEKYKLEFEIDRKNRMNQSQKFGMDMEKLLILLL